MLTLVTVMDPALPALALEALLDGADADEDEPLVAGLSIRPVTITWWPTCSARLTDASDISRMSFEPLAPLIEPGVRVLGSVALAPAEPELALPLAPVFAFLSTKPPPAPALLDGLVDEVLALLSRCRQPVAVTCPAISLDARPVGSLLCGLDVCGLGLCGLELWGLGLCGLGRGG